MMITWINQSVQGHPPHHQVETANGDVWRLFDDGSARRVITHEDRQRKRFIKQNGGPARLADSGGDTC